MRVAPAIVLTESETNILKTWSRAGKTPARLMQRAKIILLVAQGERNEIIAEKLGIDPRQVSRWRRRFVEKRLAGIEKDLPRGGRKPSKREKVTPLIIETTTQTKPANATHWSVRTLGEKLGIDKSMVYRVWQASGLKPHLSKTFKVSNDKKFIEKVIDVVGLYLNPPEHALVLCADEKNLGPSLGPHPNGAADQERAFGNDDPRLQTQRHHHAVCRPGDGRGKRHRHLHARHRHQEWIKFLNLIDRQTPAELDLHLIVDNYATHKHPKVKAWLKRHPRFHMHFVRQPSSWLNMVERWFRDLTDKRIRRGVLSRSLI